MKKFALVLLVASLLLLGGQAFADVETVDAVPAATLLLPYFEVDLGAGPGAGVTTLFEINNASAAPALAHVTVWTDWSIPVLDFDVFLTGYDVQTVNLYDVFVDGNLPITADEQSDGADSISPHGDNPAWDDSFTNCDLFFPFFINPLLQGTRLSDLQASLTGQPTTANANCDGADHGDNVARGYITVDSVNECSIDFPNDAGYFTDGVNPGIANNNNVLWGNYYIIDPANGFAGGDTLVHVEAEDGYTGGASGYTFYARYPDAVNNNREALGESWAARYLSPPVFEATNFVVWRDSTSADLTSRGCGAPGDVGTGPSWHPLNEVEVVAFDEEENAVQLCTGGGGGGVISPPLPGSPDPSCFPLETNRVATDGSTSWAPALASPYAFGWMFLNLNVGIDAPNDDYDPAGFEELAQSHVSIIMSANAGAYNVGLSAVELTAAADGANPELVPSNNIDPLIVVQ